MRLLPIALVVSLAAAPAALAKDYSTIARSVLVPGNGGTLPVNDHSLDQKKLYDDLTLLRGNVNASDVNKYYKPNVFGARGKTAVEKTTNKRVTIVLDGFGVPSITADKRADVFFGVGWMFAKERSLLGELARGPGRLTLLDPPGINAFNIITSLRIFKPSAEADAFANRQVKLLSGKKASPRLKQLGKDIRAYVDGINAQYKASGNDAKPWTMTDFVAVAGFIGSIFGRGGGDEARRSMFLDALVADMGAEAGLQAFNDLRSYKDTESNTTIGKRFNYGADPSGIPNGNRVLKNGTFTQHTFAAGRKMSNAQLMGAKMSANGRPVFVAGPQLSYYYPEIVYEVDIHANDIDARGITSAGAGPYVFIGRGEDFSWSLTSANNDINDTYVETLCGGSDTKYMYKGKCRNMTTVNAGVLEGNEANPGDQTLQWFETVHGPVQGYAEVNGQRVAITNKRSTRGREILSLLAFQDLNSHKVRSAKDFLKTMPQLEHTFNAFYADSKDIAFISTGRLPIRPSNLHTGLPVDGTGDHEWKGFIKAKAHPQQINPSTNFLLNWNNLPAPGWGAADDEWGYHRLHRNRLFLAPTRAKKKHTPASVVGVMNLPATQDVRGQLLPLLQKLLEGGTAPTPEAAQLLTTLEDYEDQKLPRLDSDGDGRYDHPATAILSTWWPLLADAVMGGRLSTDLLEQLDSFDGRGNRGGSSWVGWLDKDLRTLLGEKVKSKFGTTFCGAGDLAACRTAVWNSLEAARQQLITEQGADPAGWAADAVAERHKFVPGVIPDTIRWTNRPTYQQIAQYKGEAR